MRITLAGSCEFFSGDLKEEDMAGKKRGRSSITQENGLSAKKQKKTTVTHASHGSVEGQVLTLGEGDTGQLGLGPDIMDRTKPAYVDVPATVVQVAAGGMHTVCLTSGGEIISFGCNDEGSLGRDTSEDDSETRPGKVELKETISQVSAGDSHTAALTSDGRVYLWGTFRDASGAIGLLKPKQIERDPIQLNLDHKIIKIVSGNDHVAMLTEEGEILTIGNAEQGQLGRVAECFTQRGGRKGLALLLTPCPVHFKKRKTRFSDTWAGQYVTYALSTEGEVYAWGLNNYHQLGFDDMKNRFVPDKVKSFDPSKGWKEICGGQHHTIALDKDGKVYTIGRKEYGRLGHGSENLEDCSEPMPVAGLEGCVSVSCGTATSFAVGSDGKMYAWGMGTSNQLAQSEDDDLFRPELMKGKQLEERLGLQISAGGQHTVLLAKNKQ